MTVKYIFTHDTGIETDIAGISAAVLTEPEVITGLSVRLADINAGFYRKLSSVMYEHLVILDCREHLAKPTDASFINKAVGSLLPLLLHPYYHKHLGEKVLFLHTGNGHKEVLSGFQQEILQYGLSKVKILPYSTHYTADAAVQLYDDVGDLLPAGLHPGNDPVKTTWLLFAIPLYTGTEAFHAALADRLQSMRTADRSVNDLEHISMLSQENDRLEEKIAVLLQNIEDLNKYYRIVRGETSFKHHNRDESEVKDHTASPDAGSVALQHAVPAHSDTTFNKSQFLKHYDTVYDSMPVMYKKVGAVLKLVSGKKELRYYLNKQHKQIFLESVYALPPERQLKTWYYYEYEVLPGWYKWIGRFLRRKA